MSTRKPHRIELIDFVVVVLNKRCLFFKIEMSFGESICCCAMRLLNVSNWGKGFVVSFWQAAFLDEKIFIFYVLDMIAIIGKLPVSRGIFMLC